MKNHLWKLVTVVVVLTMLVPGLAMLLAGCGPKVIPTPVPVKPTATPVPAVPPTDTPVPKAEGLVPPTATAPSPYVGLVVDKWALWTGGAQLRGANIWQHVVVPWVDGDEFLGDGHVGPPFVQEDLDRLAAMGANYVNISGPGLFTEKPPYVLDEAVQAHLDNLLNMIARADMFAVITARTGPGRSDFTFYWDESADWGDASLLNDDVWLKQDAQDAWVEMWRYTAERYHDNPVVVGYDLMCEPNGPGRLLEIWNGEDFYPAYAGTLYDWNQLYPRIVQAIREVDPDTPILISAMGWGSVRWLPFLEPVDDPRTVYMVHQYEPQTQYTHQEPPAENIYPGEFDLDWDGDSDPFNRGWLDEYLSAIDAFKAEHGVPVAVNEFGVMRWVPGGAVFMDDEMDLFEQRGMNHALWAFNPAWPPFAENDSFDFLHGPDPDNHTEVASSDLMDVIVEHWGRNTIRPSNLTEEPSTPTGQVYYVAANEPEASDDNNGLYPTYQGGRDGPWLTIQHAASTMTAGETTYVRGGTYHESGISFAHSGAPDAPITLANYESEEVIIDGSKAKDDYPGIAIVEGRGHYVIQGLTIRHMPWSGIATDENTTELYQDITIRDCILHNNGWSGIDLAAVDGFVVENVEAYDNAYYGLNVISSDDGVLSSANGIVRNSSFHHHTGEEGHGLAINQGHDITVSDSVAYHNTIHGFDVSDWPKYGELSYNITLERNFSYDNGVAGFAINSDSHHVVYRNNVAWRNGADWAGQGSASGFLCYEGCWHVEWINNVSLENTDAGFWIEDQLGIYGTPEDTLLVFKNNIAYNNGRPEWEEERLDLVVEGEAWEVIAPHNNWGGVPGLNAFVVAINLVGDKGEIYTRDEINNSVFQAGNISVDPQFVDAKTPDVHLRPGSPCIDAGVDVGLPYLGSAPDMGAFEFER